MVYYGRAFNGAFDMKKSKDAQTEIMSEEMKSIILEKLEDLENIIFDEESEFVDAQWLLSLKERYKILQYFS
jgi:hypothetical protein